MHKDFVFTKNSYKVFVFFTYLENCSGGTKLYFFFLLHCKFVYLCCINLVLACSLRYKFLLFDKYLIPIENIKYLIKFKLDI